MSKELEQGRRRSEEVTQELSQVLEKLRNARLDNHESKRQLQRKELLEKLFRLYPKAVVRGRHNKDKNSVTGRLALLVTIYFYIPVWATV